ncbi:MAG: immunoglobulin domain-containing protein, partial [Chthoniobacteraceae bacterium]
MLIKRLSDQQYWAGGTWTTHEIARGLQTRATEGNEWECSSPLPRVGPDLARCLAAGDYEVIATAADRAGNQAEVKVAFSVEHQFLLPTFPYLTAQETPLVPESGVSTSTGLTLPPLAGDDPRRQSVRRLRVDLQGNYVTGVALSRDYGTYITPEPSTVLYKHSPTGEQIWRLERQKRSVTVQSEGLEVTHYYERFSDDQDWREIDGYTYEGMYSLGAVEMDAAGNVYAALNLYTLQYRQYATSSSGSPLFANIPTPVNHTLVVKFNPAGELVWRHVVAPSESHQSWYPTSGAISVRPLADGSAVVLIGNTQYVEGTWYSSGYVLSQTVVARVGSATGSFAKHFGFGGDFDSYALDFALDAGGNVYLVTTEAPRSANYFTTPPPEHVIRKLSTSGTLLREVRMHHADAPETWSDMAIDAATGHLYLAGNYTISYATLGHQIALKFDMNRPEGEELVWRQFGPDKSISEGMPVHLALSTDGVFLGSNGREQGSNRNVFTITRMNRGGEFAWSRKYSTPQQNFDQVGDGIEALTADDAGNVYMLGNTPRADGLGQNVVRKISSFGDVQFAKAFPLESFVQENNPEVHLLPDGAAPSSIAVLAQFPEPGQVLLFSNPEVVFPPITIPAEEPADQLVSAGADVSLAVNASGSAPLTYQWRRHEADGSYREIPGAKSASLTFSNVQLTDGGRYSVEVSNGLAAPATSRIMTLTVEPQVSLEDALGSGEYTWVTSESIPWRGQTATSADGVAAAVSGTIADGESTWLETTVTGPGTLTFHWQVSS